MQSKSTLLLYSIQQQIFFDIYLYALEMDNKNLFALENILPYDDKKKNIKLVNSEDTDIQNLHDTMGLLNLGKSNDREPNKRKRSGNSFLNHEKHRDTSKKTKTEYGKGKINSGEEGNQSIRMVSDASPITVEDKTKSQSSDGLIGEPEKNSDKLIQREIEIIENVYKSCATTSCCDEIHIIYENVAPKPRKVAINTNFNNSSTNFEIRPPMITIYEDGRNDSIDFLVENSKCEKDVSVIRGLEIRPNPERELNLVCAKKNGTSSKRINDVENKPEIENNITNKTCPICLTKFEKGTPVGIPDGGCSHTFCLDCIREWSRNVSTCPIDRSKFQNILIRQSIDGKETEIEKIIQLVEIDNGDEHIDLLEDGEVCEICGAGDREEHLLLCDGCNLGYHYDTCIIPPLYRVPRGRWYCPVCKTAGL